MCVLVSYRHLWQRQTSHKLVLNCDIFNSQRTNVNVLKLSICCTKFKAKHSHKRQRKTTTTTRCGCGALPVNLENSVRAVNNFNIYTQTTTQHNSNSNNLTAGKVSCNVKETQKRNTKESQDREREFREPASVCKWAEESQAHVNLCIVYEISNETKLVQSVCIQQQWKLKSNAQ